MENGSAEANMKQKKSKINYRERVEDESACGEQNDEWIGMVLQTERYTYYMYAQCAHRKWSFLFYLCER